MEIHFIVCKGRRQQAIGTYSSKDKINVWSMKASLLKKTWVMTLE